MENSEQVRLIFAGELMAGFQLEDVKRRFGEQFKLEGERLNAMFSGERTVLKRSLSRSDAARYLAQLQKIGARIHIEALVAPKPAMAGFPELTPHLVPEFAPEPPPKRLPEPVRAPAASTPAAAPPAAARTIESLTLTPLAAEEEIVCPSCGERQPKRVLCRSCATDMQRGIAAKKEDDDRTRAERLDEARARRGLPPSSSSGFGVASSDDDSPGLLGFEIEGRMGRVNYLCATLLSWLALFGLAIGFAVLVPAKPSVLTIGPLVIGFIAVVIWSMRVTILRLHDLNVTGWLWLLLLVPYVGFVGTLALLFIPGSREDNNFGSKPRKGSWLLVGLVVLALAIALATSWRAAKKYMMKHQSEVQAVQSEDSSGAVGAPPSQRELTDYLGSPAAVKAFQNDYWPATQHKAFAVSDSGSWGWSKGAASPRAAARLAVSNCNDHREPYTHECQLVNVNGSWLQP